MVSFVSVLFSVICRTKPFVRRQASNISVPQICHLVLGKEHIQNRPVFVVGDIHGCCDELKNIVAEARMEHKDTLFIFVGDLVNKGPKNIEVLDFLQTLGEFYAVRGNHDEVVLREIVKLKNDPDFKLASKNEWMMHLSEKHIHYLTELPYTITLPSLNSIIVHAGLIPGKLLTQIEYKDLTNMRNIIAEDYFEGRGLVGTSSISEGVDWVSLWPGPEHVYFGHDARRKLQLCQYATGLDTGCVYGGRLTGTFINGCKKRIQIPATMMYVDPN